MYEEQVERGARLLDRLRPGWASEIDTRRLAMSKCHFCIIGQLYGQYFQGCRRLAKQLPERLLFSAVQHGFTIPDPEQDGGDRAAIHRRFHALATLWRAQIRTRKKRPS